MDIIRDTKPQKKRKKLVWSIVGMTVLTVITISAFRKDDDSSEEVATPIDMP